MNRRIILLLIGLLVSAGAIVLTVLEAPVMLRSVFGVSLTSLVPGYALVSVLDPERRLGGLEQFATAMGASIAMTVVFGLLLSGSPAGLRSTTWSAGLGGLSIVLHLLALHRSRQYSGQRESTPNPVWTRVAVETGAVFAMTSVLALALVTVMATESLGSEQSVEEGEASVLQLWAVPAPEGASGDILIGLENPTDAAADCTLRVMHGPYLVLERPLILAPGESTTLHVQSSSNASVMFPVEVDLTIRKSGVVLRHVSVWPYMTRLWTNNVVDSGG